ncbi:hypothetical protein O1611_g7200 [Lasiodiplodia mahajangana]|uniref:Uncharacterized protein n=1 Tax=Lasiodiplodia mahajangana TaxID=1108764 RepID=A0ACC2JG16_9PEZI|nr:hypothetical protein O1611_g7200 [Lasiodiplodia mahajangana]
MKMDFQQQEETSYQTLDPQVAEDSTSSPVEETVSEHIQECVGLSELELIPSPRQPRFTSQFVLPSYTLTTSISGKVNQPANYQGDSILGNWELSTGEELETS